MERLEIEHGRIRSKKIDLRAARKTTDGLRKYRISKTSKNVPSHENGHSTTDLAREIDMQLILNEFRLTDNDFSEVQNYPEVSQSNTYVLSCNSRID